MYTIERSESCRLSVTVLPEDQRMAIEEMLTQIKELKKEGLESINLYNCWLGRWLVPLANRAH